MEKSASYTDLAKNQQSFPYDEVLTKAWWWLQWLMFVFISGTGAQRIYEDFVEELFCQALECLVRAKDSATSLYIQKTPLYFSSMRSMKSWEKIFDKQR